MAFDYNHPVPPTDPSCKSTFARGFQHEDWVDGQDVVQAQATSEEEGFNARFHRIEHDLDGLAQNLGAAFACIEILRGQVVQALVDIKSQFNAKPVKENKEGKDFKDQKDGKDHKDAKDGKDHKDHKDGKDAKDTPEKILGAAEKQFDDQRPVMRSPLAEFLWRDAPAAPSPEPASGRAFIRPEERPAVGGRVLAELAAAEMPAPVLAEPPGPMEPRDPPDAGDVDAVLARVGEAIARIPATRAELARLAADLAATREDR